MKRKILTVALVGLAAAAGIGIGGKFNADAAEKETLIAAEEAENLTDAEENF